MPDTATQQTHDEVLTRPWQPGERLALAALLEREWLVTNGLGGYMPQVPSLARQLAATTEC